MALVIPQDLSGLLPIFKPSGMTSTDVSRALRKVFGKLKLGHVGTLDPGAEGVLPLLVGSATKLQDYLLEMPKAYSFELTLGTATDTLDSSGNSVLELPWDHVKNEDVKAATRQFLGSITQIPPLFSAVKYKGKELYKYARSGQSTNELPLENLARNVDIKSLIIESCELPKINMFVECSKGTYVRTLALDIAETLGTTGHVTRLIRTKSAGFTISDCVTIEQATASSLALQEHIIPFDQLVIGLPTWRLDDMVLLKSLVDGQTRVISADSSSLPSVTDGVQFLLKSPEGRSVGIVDAVNLSDGRVKLHMKRGFLCHPV